MDEIKRPPLIHRSDDSRGITSAEGNASSNALPNLQMRFAVDAQYALDVDHEPTASYQDGKPPEPKAPTVSRELFESGTQRAVVLCNSDITDHTPIDAGIAARLPFADVELITGRLHDSTFLCRR